MRGGKGDADMRRAGEGVFNLDSLSSAYMHKRGAYMHVRMCACHERTGRMEMLTIRLRWVRLMTRCRAAAFSEDACDERLRVSLAVLSSASLGMSSSGLDGLECTALLGLGEVIESDTERLRRLPLFSVLPLPVEFVAGGEGRPEPLEAAPGLGGSGKSGILTFKPRKIADEGRLLWVKEGRVGRDVIERSDPRKKSSKMGSLWRRKKSDSGPLTR